MKLYKVTAVITDDDDKHIKYMEVLAEGLHLAVDQATQQMESHHRNVNVIRASEINMIEAKPTRYTVQALVSDHGGMGVSKFITVESFNKLEAGTLAESELSNKYDNVILMHISEA